MKSNRRGDYQSLAGISLISLIITIIVIIILAAIVIFTGMGTPDKAQFASVASDLDSMQTAANQAYYNLYTEKSVKDEVWTKAELFESVATGETNRENMTGSGLVKISEDNLLKMNLPKYEAREWYMAVEDISETVKVGSVVLQPGYESDGKVYATTLDLQQGGSSSTSSNIAPEEDIALNLNVGDWVDYHADVGGDECGWLVWAIEGNNVIIKPFGPVGSLTLGQAGSTQQAMEKTFNDWKNCETIINNECKKYTNSSLGITASNIRSLKIEDIEAVSEVGTKKSSYGTGQTYAYGNTVEYASGQFGVKYNASTGKNEVLESLETASASNKITVKSDLYAFGGSNIGWKTIPGKEISYGELFNTGDTGQISSYAWLASPCVFTYSSNADFLVRFAFSGGVDAGYLFGSDVFAYASSTGVAPLVSLNSNLIKTTGGDGSSSNPWVLELAD